MKQFAVKFNLIFVPFLIVGVITISLYTLLHWILFIKNSFLIVDEETLNFLGPMIFPGIPVLIWLRPRIKLLELKSKNGKGDPLFGYIMLAWIAILAPSVIAQDYLIKATGKLTQLEYISQINSVPATKYYKAKHFYIDKKGARVISKFEVSGKYNEHLDITLYVPCPIFNARDSVDKEADRNTNASGYHIDGNNPLILINGKSVSHSVSKDDLSHISPNSVESIQVIKSVAAVALYGNAAKNGAILITTKKPIDLASLHMGYRKDFKKAPAAWLAVKYEETISNSLPSDRKEDLYKAFVNKSQREFNSEALDNLIYFTRLDYSADLKNYKSAVMSPRYSTVSAPQFVLSPVNEPFETRLGHSFMWIYLSFGIGSILFLASLLFKPLKNENGDIPESTKDGSSIFDSLKIFLPREGYYITPIIIDLNIIIFIVMVCAGLGFLSFSSADLLKYGANYRPLVKGGQYWRLLTNVFLHGGFMHVLFNMYGLLFVGMFLEPVMGKSKFACTYIITGIVASLASIWWHPATVSIGASGAIFGMYGVFLALLTTNLFPANFKKTFLISTSFFVGYNLLFGLAGGIDNSAHIGGLISGLIIGYALLLGIKSRKEQTDAEAESKQFLNELNK